MISPSTASGARSLKSCWHFEEDYPAAKRVLLDTNYRCTRPIVEGAGRVIVHNKDRFSQKKSAQQKAEGAGDNYTSL